MPPTRQARQTKKAGAAKRPKQQPLIEDSRIRELDDKAEEYADIRDRRIALNQEEHDLKETLRTLMHKHHKKEYKHGGILVRLVEGEEDVKVSVKAAEVELED